MGWRLVAWRGLLDGPLAAWWPALLALLAAAGTALGEAVTYRLEAGAPLLRLLAANLTLEAGIRPALVVLAICLAVAAGGSMRRLAAPPRRLDRAASVA
jgi:hypothetical protein